MNFTLDDIEYLVINGKNRLDETGEYDISYYENYIKKDSQVIKSLIDYIQERINQVKDEMIRNFLTRSLEGNLEKIYGNMCQKNPRDESEKAGDSGAAGFYQSHPHAYYIIHDLPKYVKNNYTGIIGFMNDLYMRFKLTEIKGMYDQHVLYDIFRETKKDCKELGIRCINGKQLCDIIAENDEDKMIILEMDVRINDEEPSPNDISITSLPYFVTLPDATYKGVAEPYQMPVAKPVSVVYYNKSYIDSLEKKPEELTSMVEESTSKSLPRERKPDETDEEYIKYLREFYGGRSI